MYQRRAARFRRSVRTHRVLEVGRVEPGERVSAGAEGRARGRMGFALRKVPLSRDENSTLCSTSYIATFRLLRTEDSVNRSVFLGMILENISAASICFLGGRYERARAFGGAVYGGHPFFLFSFLFKGGVHTAQNALLSAFFLSRCSGVFPAS